MGQRFGGSAVSRGTGVGLLALALALALFGCGSVRQDEDLEAMGVCSDAVVSRAPGQELRATVRDDGPGMWVVNVWGDRPAEGTPDYRCDVVRDDDADSGFRVARIRP